MIALLEPGREYLLVVFVLLFVICVCLTLIGLGYRANRNVKRKFGLRERPERERPCDLAGAIHDHLALSERHREEDASDALAHLADAGLQDLVIREMAR